MNSETSFFFFFFWDMRAVSLPTWPAYLPNGSWGTHDGGVNTIFFPSLDAVERIKCLVRATLLRSQNCNATLFTLRFLSAQRRSESRNATLMSSNK